MSLMVQMMGIDHRDAEQLISSTPRGVRSANNDIDFQGFVRLLRDQEGKDQTRLENIHGDSDSYTDSDTDSNDGSGSDAEISAELHDALLHAFESLTSSETVSVDAAVAWAEERARVRLAPNDALHFQFSFHQRIAELGNQLQFEEFLGVMAEYPELVE